MPSTGEFGDIDTLADPDAVILIGDYDHQLEARDADQRALLEWRRRGRRGRRPRLRIFPYGAPIRTVDHTPRQIRSAVLGNMGRIRECYLEALSDRPELRARIRIQAVVNPAGQFQSVTVAQASTSDEALEGCLRGAVQELWVAPRRAAEPVLVTLPFNLQPAAVAAPSVPERGSIEGLAERASALLAVGNGAGALRVFRTLLAAAPEDGRRCTWQVDALRSAVIATPWRDDRTQAAFDALVEYLKRAVDVPEACWRAAGAELTQYVSAELNELNGRREEEDAIVDIAWRYPEATLGILGPLEGLEAHLPRGEPIAQAIAITRAAVAPPTEPGALWQQMLSSAEEVRASELCGSEGDADEVAIGARLQTLAGGRSPRLVCGSALGRHQCLAYIGAPETSGFVVQFMVASSEAVQVICTPLRSE